MTSLLKIAERQGFLWASCLTCHLRMVVNFPGGERCLSCELAARASGEEASGG